MNPFSLDQHIRNNIRLDHLKYGSGTTPAELKLDHIFNNVIDVDLDTPIYRLFGAKRFYQLLDEKQLALVNPSSWEDPFENFLLKARWELADGTPVNMASIRDRYYGQCWTLRRECDGLWQNYRGAATEENKAPYAFKVATTVRQLMNEFYDMSNPYHQLSYFLGKVRYRTDEEILNFFANDERLNTREQMANLRYTRTLLIKREAFSYEEEVRLIYSDSNSAEPGQPGPPPVHLVPVDLNRLFNYIELDPKMPLAEATQAAQRIAQAGYNGQVTQSSLYNNPNFIVRLSM
ncbi:DUF2971 domain-containing protein [Hymenobacter swuensis]|nr:DUF2971 domain-containing protein [Hymenobacter swuensis]